MIRPRKKLTEVALPLDAINKAAAREKSIRQGLPLNARSVEGAAAACGSARHREGDGAFSSSGFEPTDRGLEKLEGTRVRFKLASGGFRLDERVEQGLRAVGRGRRRRGKTQSDAMKTQFRRNLHGKCLVPKDLRIARCRVNRIGSAP